VVPCYNEADSLGELHRRVTNVCENAVNADYEIVLINDGSTDSTWPLMERLVQHDPHTVAVLLSRNHGHQLALSAGLSICVGERILVLDADLQDPPELLPNMMRLIDEGADVVYGQRAKRYGESWFKKLTAGFFYRVLDRLVDVKIPRDTGDFRLMTRRVLDILNAMPEQHRFVRGMISWIGFTQIPLIYERQQRFAGETKYPVKKMVRLALDAITSFSVQPLRIASITGAAFGFLGGVVLVYALVSWATERAVPGWTSVIVAVLILGSVQLIVMGILGEYIGRLFQESKKRPLFMIDAVVRGNRSTSRAEHGSLSEGAVHNGRQPLLHR